MTLARFGLVVALVLGGGFGCASGGPQRASDIQNLNGISDDIAAVTMTQSENLRAREEAGSMPRHSIAMRIRTPRRASKRRMYRPPNSSAWLSSSAAASRASRFL